jgi:hypothetical protein
MWGVLGCRLFRKERAMIVRRLASGSWMGMDWTRRKPAAILWKCQPMGMDWTRRKLAGILLKFRPMGR